MIYWAAVKWFRDGPGVLIATRTGAVRFVLALLFVLLVPSAMASAAAENRAGHPCPTRGGWTRGSSTAA